MGFDIVRTPTLQVVATPDERQLADDLQKRVDEAISLAEAQPEVLAAAMEQQVAEERLARLQKAERVLNQYARESREKMAAMEQAALEAIVESAAAAGKPEFRLNDLAALERHNRYTSRAIQCVVENWIPLAQVARLREESQAVIAKNRALEQIAQERAEKVLGQLREAVTEEMVLPVDMSKGVSGALLAQAAGLKHYAQQLAAEADELERSHRKRREQAAQR